MDETPLEAPAEAVDFIKTMPPVGRGRRRQFTHHEMELICAAFKDGCSAEAIADLYDVTPRRVRSLLRDHCKYFAA